MDEISRQIDEPPLYGRRRRILVRIVVLIAVGAMLLPVLANLYTVSAATAANSCMVATRHEVPDATGASARFEIFGPGVIGWECYAIGGFGGDHHVISLGLIPGMVEIPRGVEV